MNIKISLIVVSMILLVGTISALDAHLFANSTDDVLLNLSNDGHAYLTESFHGGGDVSSPTYSWITDLNSGMFSILADQIGWGLGGVTKLILDGTSLNVSSDMDICITGGNCLSSIVGDNASWNETYANTLYTNQTYVDAVNTSQSSWIDSVFLKIADMFTKVEIDGMISGNRTDILSNNDSWTTTYNESYDGSLNNASYISTYNESYADSLNNASYLSTYNESYISTYNESYAGSLNNASYLSTYNESYISTYNESYSGSLNNESYISTYNESYSGSLNNASYLTTYNASYISTYNESYAGSLNNASYLSTYNATYASVSSGYWGSDGTDIYNLTAKLGIGTVSPENKLHIKADDAKTGLQIGEQADAYWSLLGSNGLKFNRAGTSYVDQVDTGGTLNFRIGTTSALKIQADRDIEIMNGNVGIGTASPDQALHVEGNMTLDAYNSGAGSGIFFKEDFYANEQPSIVVRGEHTAASPDGLEYNAYDGHVFAIAGTDRMGVDYLGNFYLTNGSQTSGTNPSVKWHSSDGVNASLEIIGTSGGLKDQGTLYVHQSTSFNTLAGFTCTGYGGSASDECVYMYSSTNSGATLHIIQNAAGDAIKVANGSEDKHFTVSKDGDVWTDGKIGIGSTVPTTMLHLNTSSSAGTAITLSNTGGDDTFLIFDGDRDWMFQNDGDASLGTADFLHLRDNTGGNVLMTWDTSGNTGIGTTTPIETLSVEGDSFLQMTINSTGTNAGIGFFPESGTGSYELQAQTNHEGFFLYDKADTNYLWRHNGTAMSINKLNPNMVSSGLDVVGEGYFSLDLETAANIIVAENITIGGDFVISTNSSGITFGLA